MATNGQKSEVRGGLIRTYNSTIAAWEYKEGDQGFYSLYPQAFTDANELTGINTADVLETPHGQLVNVVDDGIYELRRTSPSGSALGWYQVSSAGSVDVDPFSGSTSSANGAEGLVPAPLSGQEDYFLKADGNWTTVSVSAANFIGASSSANGDSGLVPAPLSGQEEYVLQANGDWVENTAVANTSAIEADIDALSAAITGNIADISSNDADVIALSSAIDTNSTNITSNDVDIVALSAAIDSIGGNDTEALSAAITGNTANITSNDVDITALSAAIDSNDVDVIALSSEISSNDNDITALSAAIDSNDVDVIALSSEISSNDADIIYLSGQITGSSHTHANSAILDATDTAFTSAISGQITTNTSDISSVSADIISNDADIVTLSADIISNDADIVTLSADIISNDADIVTLSADIISNDADIVTLSADIISNDADIVTLSADIISNDADIVVLSAAIDSNDADIIVLSSEIDATNDSLSAKADLVSGTVPSSQLPSYVDDVILVSTSGNLSGEGEADKIYITEDENESFRWTSGTNYVQITDVMSAEDIEALYESIANTNKFTDAYMEAITGNTANISSNDDDIDYLSGQIPTVAILTGATDTVDGLSGSVPTPLSGQNEMFLKGDGTWAVVELSSAVFEGATETVSGEAGTVPAPDAGQDELYLKSDGTWAIVEAVEADRKVFITDVRASGVGSYATLTSGEGDDKGIILAVASDAGTFDIDIEWDRTTSYGGYPSVSGVSLSGYETSTSKVGNTYALTGYAGIAPNNGLLVFEYNSIETILSCDVAAAGASASAVLDQTYPGSQTELKENDVMSATVYSDSSFSEVEVSGVGCAKAESYGPFAGVTEYVLAYTVPDNGDSLVANKMTYRIKTTSDSAWKEWDDSENTVNLNNLYPTITVDSITYPGTQTALKDNEAAVINSTVTNADATSAYNLNTELQAFNIAIDGTTDVNANSQGIFNNSVSNFSLIGTRTANDATTTTNDVVTIADIAPALADNTEARLRSGFSTVDIACEFNQDVVITGLTHSGYGTLLSDTTSSFSDTYTLQMSAGDDDEHAVTARNETLSAYNMAHKLGVVDRTYALRGFAERFADFDFYAGGYFDARYDSDIGINIVDPDSLHWGFEYAEPEDMAAENEEFMLIGQYVAGFPLADDLSYATGEYAISGDIFRMNKFKGFLYSIAWQNAPSGLYRLPIQEY